MPGGSPGMDFMSELSILFDVPDSMIIPLSSPHEIIRADRTKNKLIKILVCFCAILCFVDIY